MKVWCLEQRINIQISSGNVVAVGSAMVVTAMVAAICQGDILEFAISVCPKVLISFISSGAFRYQGLENHVPINQ